MRQQSDIREEKLKNRLSPVASNGVVLVANVYDYKGRRIRKTTPTTETTFVYDGWNLINETVSTVTGGVTNTTSTSVMPYARKQEMDESEE